MQSLGLSLRPRFALIVYDLDGTLVDTLQDIAAAANFMLQHLNRPPIDTDTVRRYVGRGMHDLIGRCLQSEDEAEIDRATRIYRRFYGEHMLDNSRPYPSVKQVLEHFRARRQAVITNKPDPYATRMLQTLGLAGYFADIVAGDAEFPKKPDPASLRALAQRAGAALDETLFIGDSVVDIETGRRAGVLTIAVSHGLEDRQTLVEAKPDNLVEDFSALLRCAEREKW